MDDQLNKTEGLDNRILELEADKEALILVNAKLGYSTRLMTEFHLTQNEKVEIAKAFDEAVSVDSVVGVYEIHYNKYNNISLDESSQEFQWSPEFANNLRFYLAVSLGYDPINELSDSLSTIGEYFNLENKIRNTPDGGKRSPMVEKLMKDRPTTVESLNKSIEMVNSLNKDS